MSLFKSFFNDIGAIDHIISYNHWFTLLIGAILPSHFPFLKLFKVFFSKMNKNFILFNLLFIELAN